MSIWIANLRLWSGFFMMMLLNFWRGVSLCDGSGMMPSVTMVRTMVMFWNHRCPGFDPYPISDHFWIDIGCQVGKYGKEDKYQLDDSHFAKKSTKISVKLGNLELIDGSDELLRIMRGQIGICSMTLNLLMIRTNGYWVAFIDTVYTFIGTLCS